MNHRLIAVCAALAACGKDATPRDDAPPTAVAPTDADGDGAKSDIDCDDGNPAVYPGAVEACNAIDDDCDGTADRDPAGVGVCAAEFGVFAKVDVLLVVDNSPSMYVEQQVMSGDALAMLRVLVDAGTDFHLGAISTDMDDPDQQGRLIEGAGTRWLEPSTPNPESILPGLIQLGTAGAGTEQGLEATYAAVELLSQPGGYNDGFVRADADLSVIVLSDENDFSTTIDAAGATTWLQGLKTGGPSAILHSIVTPEPHCLGGSTPGTRYMDVSTAVGGYIQSVCDATYAPLLTDIALDLQAAVATDRFALADTPVPDSLSADAVDSGGTVTAYTAADLTWDPVDGVVIFPAPVLSGTVAIRYAKAP